MDIVEDIPISTQTQCSRIWYSGMCEEDIVITTDIDMLPLSTKYFVDLIDDIDDNKYIHLNPLNNNTYFPVCYNVGKSTIMKDIFNIDDDWEVFMRKLIHWSHRDECVDSYGVGKLWSLDETWSSYCINNYNHKDNIIPIPRKNGVNGYRIDRPNWVYDINLICEDYYYDAHCAKYKDSIDEIVEYSLSNNIKEITNE